MPLNLTSTMNPRRKDNRDKIFDLVRGKTVTVPDLQAMMAEWPAATNPNLELLEKATNARFKWLFPGIENEKRLRKMKKTYVAQFASMWWPYAAVEALHTAAWLCIWLFVWDDETDSAEFSDIVHDFDRACDFRTETLHFIRDSLRLPEHSEPQDHPSPSDSTRSLGSENIIINNFEDVGRAISEFENGRLAAIFYDELEVFVKMTELEQKVHLSGELPTVSEYLERRMGSSGVHICLVLNEYALNIEIPEAVYREPEMKVLWHETNMNISVCNDILSAKKELQVGQTDSLIPLLAVELGSVQAALDVASKMLQDSVIAIDAAAEALLARHALDTALSANLRKFIDGCKYACTANLNWSVVSGRYKLGCDSLQGGFRSNCNIFVAM